MRKIGIFGGTFDPLHMGHINSMITVAGEFELDEIRVIPAFQSPFRLPTEGPTPQQRFEMTRVGLENYKDILKIDGQEIERGGVSYTIDTIEKLSSEKEEKELYLTVGMDQFEAFDRWKNFSQILTLANLIVTSRPGADLPESLQEFPLGLVDLVEDFDGQQALLNTGRSIYFIQLEDTEISSTEVRKALREKTAVTGLMPKQVHDYIRENGLYEAISSRIGDFEKFTHFCGDFLLSKKSIHVLGFDLRDFDFPSEFTLITSGTSTRQTTALAQNLMREVKTQYGVYPQNVEGVREGRWVVLDYGSLIIHIFYDYVRQEYRLEELWREAPRLNLQ